MKRLGLLSTDRADRFFISACTCSEIFQCWIRAMSECLSCIVHIPSEESIRSTLPVRFINYCYLMGTPKDLNFQSVTWSDYKHHNTIKYLISVAPNSFITYIPKPYTGRISDKALTIDSGYLDLLPAYSRVMADKGFNIADECAARHLYFTVPPGKSGCSQMTPSEVKKTSDIAKLRILVEQVIRRMKTFRIIAGEVPISLLGHMNDILIVTAAICNLKNPIFKD